MDKKLQLKLNAGRVVTGVLRGFDPYMNLVVHDAVEETKDRKNNIGTVVNAAHTTSTGQAYAYSCGSAPIPPLSSPPPPLPSHHLPLPSPPLQVIRGNSIVMIEALERIF